MVVMARECLVQGMGVFGVNRDWLESLRFVFLSVYSSAVEEQCMQFCDDKEPLDEKRASD